MIKPPSKNHVFGIGRDIAGNTSVILRVRGHYDYIYGMYKGREAIGGHLESIESWHVEGEQVLFTAHPIEDNIVLVMGVPVVVLKGDEADAIIAKIQEGECT